MTARWLLVAVPLALGLAWWDAPPMAVFAASLISIVPLVGLIGDATERLAARLGPTLGGLLNSTLNNLPELIIGGVALSNGLASVVKASLTGAILANLLVSLGIALIAGGIRHGEQKFDPRRLAVNGSMLMICAFCFIVPAMFSIGTPEGTRDLSFEMSFVLIGMYLMNVAVTLFGGGGGTSLPDDQEFEGEHAATPVWRSLLVLVSAGGCLGLVTEVLSHALEPTARQLGLSNTFSGLVLLGGAGSLGEVLSGFHFARHRGLDDPARAARRAAVGIRRTADGGADGSRLHGLRGGGDRAGNDHHSRTDRRREIQLVRGVSAARRLSDPRDRLLPPPGVIVFSRHRCDSFSDHVPAAATASSARLTC